MDKFTLLIISDQKTYFSGHAEYCGIVTELGSAGLEAHHENFMAVLEKNSVIEYRDTSGKTRRLKTLNGIASFRDNTCTVMTTGTSETE